MFYFFFVNIIFFYTKANETGIWIVEHTNLTAN